MTVPPTRSPNVILVALASCGVLVSITQTIVVPLLPQLPGLTGSSASNVSWLVTATLLTGAVCTPLLGRAGDMYGKRRVLLLALGAMVAGSLLCALSTNLPVLIAGRALQGASIALVPLGISILRDELPPERVTSAIGFMSATLGLGGALGIPAATLVVQYADWHTMFWVCAALSVLIMVVVIRVVPESPIRTNGRFDTVGALGLTVFLLCVLVPISKGGVWGWTAPVTLAMFAVAAIVAPIWTIHQLRIRQPMVDLRVSARPAVLFTNLTAILVGFAFYANGLTTAQLVQEPTATGYGLGASIVVAGLCMLPGGIVFVLLSPVSARISATRGPRFTLALGAVILIVGYALRMVTNTSLVGITIGATVIAVGTAAAYSALPALIMHAVPVSETAAANGLNTLMRSMGQAVCSAVVATVLASMIATTGGHTGPTLGAYLTVFAIAGACSIAALGCTLLIPVDRRDPGAAPAAPVLAGRAA